MRIGPVVIGAVLLATALPGMAGCGGGDGGATPAGAAEATGTHPPTAPTDARAQLAALAAAAKDRRMVGFYTLRTRQRPDRAVVATLAVDGTWRVDVPAGAQGGTVDVAIAATKTGLYQCVLPSRSQSGSCVRVAAPDGTLPPAVDPRVPHVFTDWRQVLTDRRAPLSVAPATAPQGVTGACYSVESTSASLTAPVDPGIYCYTPDGTLTGAHTGFGTLVLASPPGAAPPTVVLPAAVVAGQPLPTAVPPSHRP